MKRVVVILWAMFFGSALAADIGDYDYPVTDPFEATVVGTPPEMRYRVKDPKKLRERIYSLDVFPHRKVPNMFWHVKKLKFSLAYQNKPAPLIFVIAGTGGSYQSETMRFMQNIFYQAGFHVISLSSPTSYDFITAASVTRLPGIGYEDAQDLYRVMQLANDKIKDRIEITDYYLTGYSLGGLNAAFVSYLDEQEQVFGFRKVLLLNPPVSLYTAVRIMDRLVLSDPATKTPNEFFDKMLNKLTGFFKDKEGAISIGDEALLFKFQDSRVFFTTPELMTLIGAAFRFLAADMVFTADVLNNSGYVVEKNKNLTVGTPLTPYYKRALWWRYVDYFEHMLLPYWHDKNPGDSRQDFIRKTGLVELTDYLRESDKIGVITNADEIIMTTADLKFIEDIFGSKATIFPWGGHLGNMQHNAYVDRMLDFFTGEQG